MFLNQLNNMKPQRGFENLENNAVSIDMFSLREKRQLFDTSVPNTNIHISNIIEDNELGKNSVIKKYLTTAADIARRASISIENEKSHNNQNAIGVSYQ